MVESKKHEIVTADLRSERHASDFLSILNAYAEDIMGGGKSLAKKVKVSLTSKLLELPNHLLLLSYCDGEVSGIANCFYGFSTFKARPLLNIHDFAIAPKYRKMGISKLLLDRLEEIAIEQDCCKLTLEVLENNHRAKKVYTDFGFNGYELDPEMGKAVYWEKVLKEKITNPNT